MLNSNRKQHLNLTLKPNPRVMPGPKRKPSLIPTLRQTPELGAQADANAGSQTEVKAEPEPVSRSDIAALLKMPLGDVLMAGLLENPDEAGRLIAQSITQTEARIVTENTPEAAPEPKPDAKTPPVMTPKAAE